MFGKQDRFEEPPEDEVPGPGAYDLPSTLELSRSPETEEPSPGTPLQKENRVPLSARLPGAKQRVKDLRLASHLDLVRDELKQKSREAKELQVALASKDRKIEELSKRIEDSALDRREAYRRASEAEGEMGQKRRQIYEKEQEILALQRKLEHARLATKEWTKRVEKKDDEHRSAENEMLRMRQSLDSMQEQLATVGKEQISAEQSLRLHQQRSADLEAGLKSHIDVLEEQLALETARRKDLEERQVQDYMERQESVRAVEHCEALQGKVAELEVQLKHQESEQRSRMEEEMQSLRSALEASAAALRSSEAAKEELLLEVGKQKELAQELSSAKARVVSIEEELQRGEHELKEQTKKAREMERSMAEREESWQLRIQELQQPCDPDELEARALRAEAEAEEVRVMLERWKEWGDEQQLRELSAETERLERIKQVREEVTQQVEAARLELVAENRTLHQRIRELEQGPVKTEEQLKLQAEALRDKELEFTKVQAQLKQLEKQKLEWQEQISALHRRAATAEEKLADSAKQLTAAHEEIVGDQKVLEEERTALRVSEEKVATLEEAVVEAAGHIADGQSRICWMRWQQLADSILLRVRDDAWKEATRHKRPPRKGPDPDQEVELERLDKECEELREQNAQVLLTLQLQQQDLQVALAEVHRLSEREAIYERDVLSISERSAELGGHANPKQKIKHLVAMKEENQSLRQEVKRSQQTSARLEAQLRAAHFAEVVELRGSASSSGSHCAKEQRAARAQRRTSETAAHAYQHLCTLVERALAIDTAVESTTLATCCNGELPEHPNLYRRLRGLQLQPQEAVAQVTDA